MLEESYVRLSISNNLFTLGERELIPCLSEDFEMEELTKEISKSKARGGAKERHARP